MSADVIQSLLELSHQFVGFIVVEAVVGLANRSTQFANLVTFFRAVEGVEHHLADGLGLGHVLGKMNGVFVFGLVGQGDHGFFGVGIRH